MSILLEKIDEYLNVQEKKESISISFDREVDINDVIDLIKKSDNTDNMPELNDEIKSTIEKLKEGGII